MATDRDTQDLVAFNLMLCLQACTDIAQHIISDEGWPPATSTSMSFYLLADHSLISRATAETLAKASGLRNLIAHGYAKLEHAKLREAATAGLSVFDAFARELTTHI